jgi:hypothetical protein
VNIKYLYARTACVCIDLLLPTQIEHASTALTHTQTAAALHKRCTEVESQLSNIKLEHKDEAAALSSALKSQVTVKKVTVKKVNVASVAVTKVIVSGNNC